MKIAKLDIPEIHVNTVIFDGKEVMLPGKYDGLWIVGDADSLDIYLENTSGDFSWLLANVIPDVDLDRISYTFEVRDGLNIDQIIEDILKGE